jgi:hypothetical protein
MRGFASASPFALLLKTSQLPARQARLLAQFCVVSAKISAVVLGAGLLLALACGCSHPRTLTQTNRLSPLPALHQGPLTDYVPAAGLRWLLVGQPKSLAQSPELLTETNRLLSKERLDAFATSSGVARH